MIVVYHKNNRISKVVSDGNAFVPFDDKALITEGLYKLAVRFPQSKIVWCNDEFQQYLNLKAIDSIFHHNKMMLSYTLDECNYLGEKIGYVEESPFIKINKKVPYPTWQMSSLVGVVHASVLIAIKDKIKFDQDFDYFLCSMAKLGMRKGLLCYSEPRLLKQNPVSISTKTSSYTLFRFVKQHYRTRWVFLLLLNLMVYERKFQFLPFLFSFFYKNRNKKNIDMNGIAVQSFRKVIDKETVDVIIPTIGRSDYLHDVLKDLALQTHLPVTVIIVEQNPVPGIKSELDYLHNKEWPFEIQHIFTHQAGACNARNLALNLIKSEWVFLADDDIRVEVGFIQKALEQINNFGTEAVSFKCFQKGQKQTFSTIFQWVSFGSGCSFVLAESLKNCSFNMGYEFGFGEDADFGMQLRNQGHDVLYLPEPEILHLKAPVGGFRTTPVLRWYNDNIQPKPSPTIMLYLISHNTKQQILGYKITLFFKFYKHQNIKNPFSYFKMFQKQWNRSIFWANKLNEKL